MSHRYRDRLLDVLTNQLSTDELKSFAFLLEFADFPEEGSQVIQAIRLIEFAERNSQVHRLVEVLNERKPNIDLGDLALPITSEKGKVPDKGEGTKRLLFTNRADEIRLIMSSHAPSYYLVDAPVGYGKSTLLRALKGFFSEDEQTQWICVYLIVREHDTIGGLAARLARELNLEAELDVTQDAGQLGLSFAGAVRRECFAIEPQGLVLLLDFEGRPPIDLIDIMLKNFIPNIQKSLQTLTSFKTEHNRFRVVLSGRYLAGKKEVKEAPIPLSVLELKPFNYRVIRDAAQRYLSDQDEDSIEQITAHIAYLTGGHPGLIEELLYLYDREALPPEEFLSNLEDHIWDNILRPGIEKVRSNMQEAAGELSNVIEQLSTFRYIDYEILRILIQDKTLPTLGDANEFDLADQLTSTYFMCWRGRLLGDDITRNLLVFYRWRTLSSSEFGNACRHAQSIYLSHLQNPSIQMPERWALEYMFQGLQQYSPQIGSHTIREQARQEFFTVIVPRAVDALGRDRALHIERNALLGAMEEDWRFQFTVNYYLREDIYTSAPYEDLYLTIADLR
jgi:hypothetical protein